MIDFFDFFDVLMFRFSREREREREREMGKNQDVKDGQKDEERGKMDGGKEIWRESVER